MTTEQEPSTDPGSTYTITTSADEDKAIAHTAGDPNVDKQTYLEACVHGQLLEPWTRNYYIATAPVPPIDVATGYVTATPQQQEEIHQILGLTPTPPPDGGGTPPPTPTVTTFNYQWQRTAPPAAAGQVRTDPPGTDWTTPTVLSLAKQTADSQDASATLALIGVGTTIDMTDGTPAPNTPNSLSMTVTGMATDTGTAMSFPVSATANTGVTPANGTAVTVTITVPAPPAARLAPAGPERTLTF
jgi:hypothetical protein